MAAGRFLFAFLFQFHQGYLGGKPRVKSPDREPPLL